MSKRFDAIRYMHENKLGAAVAEACGISRQAVFQWRKVPVQHIDAVANVLNVSKHKVRSLCPHCGQAMPGKG